MDRVDLSPQADYGYLQNRPDQASGPCDHPAVSLYTKNLDPLGELMPC